MLYVIIVALHLKVVLKTFTGIMNNIIKAVIEDHDLLSDAHFGFRPQTSTVDVIFVLRLLVNKITNEKGRLV